MKSITVFSFIFSLSLFHGNFCTVQGYQFSSSPVPLSFSVTSRKYPSLPHTTSHSFYSKGNSGTKKCIIDHENTCLHAIKGLTNSDSRSSSVENNKNKVFGTKPISSHVEIYNSYTDDEKVTQSFYQADIEHLSHTNQMSDFDLQNKIFESTVRGPQSKQQRQGEVDTEHTNAQRQIDIFKELQRKKVNRSPDFEANVGKVIDTLMKDYRDFFHRVPNFDIYTNDIKVMDPSGVRLNGKLFYKQFFAMLRLVKTVALDRTLINYKVSYDWAEQEVKVQWNLKIWLRALSNPRYIDGVSRYSINNDGKVCSHVIDNLIINNTPVEPPYALEWMSLEAWTELLSSDGPQLKRNKQPVPELIPGLAGLPRISNPGEFGFTMPGALIPVDDIKAVEGTTATQTLASGKQVVSSPKSRKQVVLHASAKTVEETDHLDSDEMTQERRRKLLGIEDEKDDGFEQGGDLPGAQKAKKKNSIFGDLGEGMGLPASCETHGDCDHPMFCCDFILFKTCCDKGGLMMPLPEPQSYPHPSYARPVRVKAEYPKTQYPDYPREKGSGGYSGTNIPDLPKF